MSGLARAKDIAELTEETFYRMVGDYFAAKERIAEIDGRMVEFDKAKESLPPMKAFESFAAYLAAQRSHDAFEELTEPVVSRLQREKADRQQHLNALTKRLEELLPDRVWIRYADKAIRSVKRTPESEYRRYRKMGAYIPVGAFKNRPDFWYELQIEEWKKVAPIPPAITRTKPQGSPNWIQTLLRWLTCSNSKQVIGTVED